MSSNNNRHPTAKSLCWTMFLFIATSLFVLHMTSSVSRMFRVLSIRKTLHSSQIYLLQSMSSVRRKNCMMSIRKTLHSNQIYLRQSMPPVSRCFRMLSIRKTLFRIQICLPRSFSHLESFLTSDQPFHYCNSSTFWIHSPLCPYLESQTPCDIFGDLTIYFR